MGLEEWTSEGRAQYSNGRECCGVSGWRAQLLMGLGEWTSEGKVLYSCVMVCCVCHETKRVLRLNSSVWDWESGLQMEGYCIVV